MLPSELINPSALGPSQYLPLNFYTLRIFFTFLPQTTTTPALSPHPHTCSHFSSLCSFFARCLRFKGLGNLCSHLDWGTEMSCSHAVDVERSKARFSSMCHWALKQNVQDVLWLPRIPGDIIIPSLSFLSPPPSASALTLPYPTLGLYAPLYMEYSLNSIACHLFWFKRSCQRTAWREQIHLPALADSPVDRLPWERVAFIYTECFCHLWMHPIYVWFR